MRVRLRAHVCTLLFVLLVACTAQAGSNAWTTTATGNSVIGSGAVLPTIGFGQCAYRDVSSVVSPFLLGVAGVKTRVVYDPDKNGTATNGQSIRVRRCPAGTTVYSANTCTTTPYRNSSGAVVDTLDGNPTTGTDRLEQIAAEVLAIEPVTITRTTLVEVCTDY